MLFNTIMKKILFSGINKKLIIYFYFNNIFKSFKYYNLNKVFYKILINYNKIIYFFI